MYQTRVINNEKIGASKNIFTFIRETVLVTAAAGSVGLATVDLATNVFGAKVIGAAGSQEKCDLIKSYGALDAINYKLAFLIGLGYKASLLCMLI